jgi:hypothetical protein
MFMSPEGWEHYHQRREEAGHSEQAITASPEFAPHMGGSWFSSPNNDGLLAIRTPVLATWSICSRMTREKYELKAHDY